MPARIPTDDLLADLRRVADEIGHAPSTAEYQEHGEYACKTIQQRFDADWNGILVKAGLEKRSSAVGIKIGCPNCGITHYYNGDRDRFNCPSCQTTIQLWRGHIEAKAENTRIRLLATGPQPGNAFDGSLGPSDRHMVDQLQAPRRSHPNKARGQPTTIYYLYGDERAAIRRFIEENHEYVESCLADQSNPLQRNWDESLYQMLVEQWQWVERDVQEDTSHQ